MATSRTETDSRAGARTVGDDATAALPEPTWLDRAHDYPFRSRWLRVDGSRVHYLDEGEGPTLLFLHANPLWSFYFRKLLRLLRARFRCVALDYPGFGLSEADSGHGFRVEDHARVVKGFIERLDLAGITLVAHDAGAPIGLHAAIEHPGRFRALVLSDCFAWPLSEDPKVARMLRIVSSRPLGLLVRGTNFLPRVITAAGIRGTRLTRSERAAYLGPFRTRRSRHVQTRLFRSYVDRGGEAFMRRLREGLGRLADRPTLVLFGAGDPVAKLGFPDKLARLLPRSRVVLVDGQQHFPHDGAAEEIAQIVTSWWDRDVASEAACDPGGPPTSGPGDDRMGRPSSLG